jgi:hypothetical protein
LRPWMIGTLRLQIFVNHLLPQNTAQAPDYRPKIPLANFAFN